MFGTIKVSGETGIALEPGNGVGDSRVVAKAVLKFPVHHVVSAFRRLDRRSVSMVIEMAYGKDHHRYPVACRLSAFVGHQAWVHLVVEVMMVVCCAVQFRIVIHILVIVRLR